MPNIISATGLTTATKAELLAQYTLGYQSIYGFDINLESDTPDGQMMNLFIQSVLDVEDLLTQIYNMFDPDNAIGVVLDQRVAINGIQRQIGTYTITPATIGVSSPVNLYGLDQAVQPVYTVADNAGNKWQLQVTQLGVMAGSYIYNFQAAEPGAVLTVPNTITIPVTIVLGVSSINNPTTYTTLGINEESDAALKIRRQRSVSLASQGYLKGLLAALENITGVTSAFVYENNSSTTNGDGVPGHSIWVIVAGTGAASEIANAIYTKRNAGCGMFGSISYVITQVDGSAFIVQWDLVSTQNLFIQFTATSIDGVNPPNIAAIVAGLPSIFTPGVSAEVNITTLGTLVQMIDPNTLVTLAGFSAGTTQILLLSGIAASGTFTIAYGGNSSASINWNDPVGTIQTKVRAVPGLSSVVVTGSIASQVLTFALPPPTILTLLTVPANSLQTVAPAAITFQYQESFTNTLTPTSKKYQFVVSSANIIVVPMILSPVSSQVTHGNTQQYTGLGGYGALTYSLQSNLSGGSINAVTGLYASGSAGFTDTVKVTDALGNTATASVTVI